MQISNDGGFAGAVWEPYTTHKTWQITQYGTSVLPRIVYIRYKDQQGQVSAVYQDDIILDMTPPRGRVHIVQHTGLHTASSSQVTLQLSATDDISGVGEVRISNRPDFADAVWQHYVPEVDWQLKDTRTVYVQFRDNAGNMSPTTTASIQHQTYLPLVTR